MKNANGLSTEKECGDFHFIIPTKATLKDCYDAAIEFANKIVEFSKKEEEKAKEKADEVAKETSIKKEDVEVKTESEVIEDK